MTAIICQLTDGTAKAILDLPDDAIINLSVPTNSTFPQYEGYSQSLDVKIDRIELQRMAKLWLMRDELCSHLESRDPVRINIEKLAALEEK